MTRIVPISLLAVLTVYLPALLSSRVFAETIFSTVDPSDLSSGYVAAAVLGPDFDPSSPGGEQLASEFVVPSSSDFQFDSATWRLICYSGLPTVDMALMSNTISNSGDDLPGTTLELISNIVPPVGVFGPLTTVASVTHPILHAGVKYWLAGIVANGSTDDLWALNLHGIPGQTAVGNFLDDGSINWRVLRFNAQGAFAFQIDATPVSVSITPVPEPTGMTVLIAVSLSGMGLLMKKRRR